MRVKFLKSIGDTIGTACESLTVDKLTRTDDALSEVKLSRCGQRALGPTRMSRPISWMDSTLDPAHVLIP